MAILEIVDEINLLKEQYDSLKPFRKEDEERFWRKLRLEWNYNSNHIEGNTLTYGETELLIMFGKTGDSTKDLRDYEEMKAHDVTIRMVKEMAEDKERDLTEADIRQLNKVLLVEPFYKDAITASGEPTQKKIIPGEYKTTSNSVKTKTGEIFQFATVEETPALMTELIDWYRKAVVDNEHPLYIASLLHYRFVRIHPFDDGNGRTARLLANYVLMKYGYPPTVIKSDDKSNYIGALNQADTGNLEAFVEYIGKTVVAGLEMAIKAGKGESIEEQGDIDKEIALFKREVSNKQQIKKSPKVIYETYLLIQQILWDSLVNNTKQFYELFSENRENRFVNYELIKKPKRTTMGISEARHLLLEMENKDPDIFGKDIYENDINSVAWELVLFGLKTHANGQSCHLKLFVAFFPSKYKISISLNQKTIFENGFYYSHSLTENETNEIIDIAKKGTLAFIKQASQ